LLSHRKYNNRAIRLPILVLFLLLFTPIKLLAQDETAIRPVIESGDLKKLMKADAYKDDADKLIEEANRLNMEVFSVQADPDLDEKAVTKKTGQLEDQAREKQVQASALYEKCNEIKFTVYKKYLDDYWNTHAGQESDYLNAKLLDEQASDNYFQAASYRIDAKRMDEGYAKVEKLTEADNLEIQAIQKQLTALGIYYGIEGTTSRDTPAQEEIPAMPEGQAAVKDTFISTPAAPVASVSPETTLPGQVALDPVMMERYNRYITSGQFIDTTLSTGQIAGITSFDTDTILQLWYEYLYGHGAVETTSAFATEADTLQEITEVLPSEQKVPSGTENAEIGVITDENVGHMIPADEEVIYRVQLAANRSELSQRALSRMYYGNKGVEMINENGWYKYSVGDFDTYEEASKFRKSTGLTNAFVVAYRKGTKFTPGTAAAEIKPAPAYTPVGEQKTPAGLIFRIQVAASRNPLTIGQLEKIYPGKYPVEMILEDGWYKYQFMGVRLYSDAVQIIQNVTTSGAFIVAYENGTKINLAEAVKVSRELERTVQARGRKGNIDEIEYHLQIAASRTAMKLEELQMIYSGSEPVAVIHEDGWYKYHLKAGNSPELAEQFKQASNVAKAFIVPYKRAAKITYYQAVQENR
jgi:hypothetical protein